MARDRATLHIVNPFFTEVVFNSGRDAAIEVLADEDGCARVALLVGAIPEL